MANKCQAKNPSTCWKHGSGETTSLIGASAALKSAQKEIINTHEFDQYEECKTAIQKYERRIAFLKGKNLLPQEKNIAYSEMLKDAETEYDAAVSRAATDPVEHQAVTTHFEVVLDNLAKESPSSVFTQDMPYIAEGEPYSMKEKMAQQESEAAATIAHFELEGYIPAVTTFAHDQTTYFYKKDDFNPINFGTWSAAQSKHGPALLEASKNKSSVRQLASQAMSLKPKTFASFFES